MDATIQRLHSLCVSDVMTREVVCLEHHQTMDEAAQLLRGNLVTFAPVVDDQGRCVGILSSTDFLQEHEEVAGQPPLAMEAHQLVDSPDDRPHEIEDRPLGTVSRFMSSRVISVADDAPLLAAARVMQARRLHRLVVLDTAHRPQGIVSTMDVIAALMQALDASNRDGLSPNASAAE